MHGEQAENLGIEQITDNQCYVNKRTGLVVNFESEKGRRSVLPELCRHVFRVSILHIAGKTRKLR